MTGGTALLDYLGGRDPATLEKVQTLKPRCKRHMLFVAQGAAKVLSGVNHLRLFLDGSAVQAKAYIGARRVPVVRRSAR